MHSGQPSIPKVYIKEKLFQLGVDPDNDKHSYDKRQHDGTPRRRGNLIYEYVWILLHL